MPLNGTTGGDAVFSAIQAYIATLVPDEHGKKTPDPQKIWEAIMTAIYADIKANAVIPAAIGVQVNPSSGTGATTGTGTIT
jgi:hypothetical protein